jgi:L-amino acid N-acyltransferase YncA
MRVAGGRAAMLIRDAVKEDFHGITEIYNDVVLHSTAIFRETPITVEDALSLWRSRLEARSPTIVALRENRIVGYASFGTFRSSPGYLYTVEHTVHVEAAARGTGVGSALVRELITRAQALGKHVMVGAVDAENVGSLQFHERLGFKPVARFEQVGFKFNKYLDLIFVQRLIGAGRSA